MAQAGNKGEARPWALGAPTPGCLAVLVCGLGTESRVTPMTPMKLTQKQTTGCVTGPPREAPGSSLRTNVLPIHQGVGVWGITPSSLNEQRWLIGPGPPRS